MSAQLTRSVADVIEAFVRAEGQVADDDPDFDHDVQLFEAGYLDSLGVMRLIEHLEATYGIELSDDALLDPRFTTIGGMSAILTDELAVRS
jgi:acyl carrier protein